MCLARLIGRRSAWVSFFEERASLLEGRDEVDFEDVDALRVPFADFMVAVAF